MVVCVHYVAGSSVTAVSESEATEGIPITNGAAGGLHHSDVEDDCSRRHANGDTSSTADIAMHHRCSVAEAEVGVAFIAQAVLSRGFHPPLIHPLRLEAWMSGMLPQHWRKTGYGQGPSSLQCLTQNAMRPSQVQQLRLRVAEADAAAIVAKNQADALAASHHAAAERARIAVDDREKFAADLAAVRWRIAYHLLLHQRCGKWSLKCLQETKEMCMCVGMGAEWQAT